MHITRIVDVSPGTSSCRPIDPPGRDCNSRNSNNGERNLSQRKAPLFEKGSSPHCCYFESYNPDRAGQWVGKMMYLGKRRLSSLCASVELPNSSHCKYIYDLLQLMGSM